MDIALQPIGFVTQGRASPVDDHWDAQTSLIALDPAVLHPEATMGLETFSHVEIIFWFHHPAAEKADLAARHPRGNPDWPRVGILAQRAKNRPNRLGLTTCRLLAVNGPELKVAGLDAIAGTPILDIKPYMSDFAPRGDMREPDWARELMRDYW